MSVILGLFAAFFAGMFTTCLLVLQWDDRPRTRPGLRQTTDSTQNR